MVLFSIGVKIFPYASEINSIRIVLVKFFELTEGAAEDGGGSTKGSKKSKSRSGKSNQGGDKVAQDAPPTAK